MASESIVDRYVTVPVPGTPVPLSATTTNAQRFKKIVISGFKAAKTANVGRVWIRPVGGTGWLPIDSEQDRVYEAQNSNYFNLSDLEIDAVTANDGVYITT